MISSPVELAVEFERPRLNRQGSRACAGLCRLVGDADFHPELTQPERQGQAGGTGADDQNVAVHHFVLRSSAWPAVGISMPRSAVRACWSASARKSPDWRRSRRRPRETTWPSPSGSSARRHGGADRRAPSRIQRSGCSGRNIMAMTRRECRWRSRKSRIPGKLSGGGGPRRGEARTRAERHPPCRGAVQISSPKSLSTFSALTPPHPSFAHGDVQLVIHSEPTDNCVFATQVPAGTAGCSIAELAAWRARFSSATSYRPWRRRRTSA